LAALTRSDSEDRPLSTSALFALLLGLAAVVILPAAILYAEKGDRITLLESSVSIIPVFAFAIGAVYLARRARRAIDRTLGRMKGSRLAQIGRILGYVGLYMAVTASISVATYYVLRQIA
jgi:hypothetical protein